MTQAQTMHSNLAQRARRFTRRVTARLGLGPSLGRTVEGIPGPIHDRDTMYDPSEPRAVEYYLRAGQSAVRVLESCLAAADREPRTIERVLDYGCGFGRVLRHLPWMLPRATFVACDLDAQAVDFCQRAFGAHGVVAPADPKALDLPACDLIWGGSVFTHLPEPECRALFGALAASLRSGGILVFSFHGAFAYQYLDALFGGAYAGDSESIKHDIAATEFSYRAYPQTYLSLDEGGYGTAWHTPDYFRRLIRTEPSELIEVAHQVQGWDSFHDVIAFQRCK